MSKYHRLIGSEKTKVQADVYDILTAFKVVCPARQHAIKKLLCAGQRGAKSEMQDLEEAAQSVGRAIGLAKAYQAPRV